MSTILKKTLFPLVSVFLAFRSWEMISLLLSEKAFSIGSGWTIGFSLGLCLCITGVFAMVGFAYPTHRLLPATYYHPKSPKQLRVFYDALGVKYFRVFLLIFFWGGKNRKKYFDGTRSGVDNFIYQTKQSEFGHLMPLLLLQGLAIALLIRGQIWEALSMSLLNMIGNFYPIILQRYHRMRVEQVFGTNGSKKPGSKAA